MEKESKMIHPEEKCSCFSKFLVIFKHRESKNYTIINV